MCEVIKFYSKDAAKDPDAVLEQAIGNYKDVFIIGWDKEDYLDVRSNTNLKANDLLWLLERVKYNLISGEYSE